MDGSFSSDGWHSGDPLFPVWTSYDFTREEGAEGSHRTSQIFFGFSLTKNSDNCHLRPLFGKSSWCHLLTLSFTQVFPESCSEMDES